MFFPPQYDHNLCDRSAHAIIRNKYVSELRKKEITYYRDLIDESARDNKKMWRALKEVMGNNKRNEINSIKYNGNLISDTKIIADSLNTFFVDSIKEISESIPHTSSSPTTHANNNMSTFKFSEISVEDVKSAINQINSKGDLEKVTPQVLLDALPVMGDLFASIINESFKCGTFPNWKCATITPVEKIKNALLPEDFRPINNLPAYEKVIEIIAKNQLEKFIQENKILVENQSGFRKNHSCETALNFVMQDWKDEIDNGKIILCVFLDLKRAFETIDRDLLLEKLSKMGISDNEHKWFESFLKNRLQKTKINDVTSKEIENEIGLAQGTVLATLLFVIYINDINTVIQNGNNSKLKLFADDTLVYICTDNYEDGIRQLNETLAKINEYLIKFKLKLNVTKTKAMMIKSNRKIIDKEHVQIMIKDDKIEIVDQSNT